jgi:two-component system phosphate regulon sensor histidine kinase PhoR
MIAHTTDAMIAIDSDFQVLDFNPAANTMLNWTAENALDYPCSEVLRCRNLHGTVLCGTSSCPLVRALSGEQPLNREELLIGAIMAQPCEVTTSVTPMNLDQQPYVVFTARDISELRGLNRMRTNFVSMVSHELRTPLNSVHGFIELLMQGHMGELTQEQKTYLGYAQEGVLQLISIAEDILLMTRSDSGQFEIKPEEVNFRVLARQVVSSLQPQALKAGVEIKKDIPSPSPMLYVDPQRMKQVLNNLVTNAIKFTPPGGTVTIAAHPYDERFVLISVSDTGFGISAEDRPHVFERFYQSNHRHQSKLGGYGLGLPIARLIVEQHGGQIDFETEINRGTTFYFTTPAYRPGSSSL